MADLLALSARFIDEGIYEGPGSVNRITTELSEVGPGIALIEAFSHIAIIRTEEGLVLFDTSLEAFGAGALESLRHWSGEPVNAIAFTHGHIDHVGGAGAFIAEAREKGQARPRVIGHENLLPRYDRYEFTNGYNARINQRQFQASGGKRGGFVKFSDDRFGPKDWIRPDTVFHDRMSLKSGNEVFDLYHAKGETDDHLWAFVPNHKTLCVGDFLTWVFPNAGNPQKVQRYPLEWAKALREMQALGAELLLPAHGLPIGGAARIARVLGDVATALETLVRETVSMMNAGARLADIVHSVTVPADLMERPYLRPVYDEPEFVIRNIWRLYGGWWDGNPAHLKPARDEALAGEIARLAGGVTSLTKRAVELAAAGDFRLASHLIEFAAHAEPENSQMHSARAEIYEARRKAELSLMAKGVFGSAAEESAAKLGS